MDMTEFHKLRHDVNVAATKIDDELGKARADNPPVDGNAHVQAAHSALGQLGDALLALDAWGKRQEGAGPPPPPPPGEPPTAFASRADFLAWAATQAQAQNLDGTQVHSGFGPAQNWYTQSNGTIGLTEPVTTEPPPPPIPPPAGVLPFPETPDSTISTRKGRMRVGQVYAVTLDRRSRVTCASNGQGYHWCSLDADFPLIESRTQAAMGTSPPMICEAGLVYVKLGDGFTGHYYDGNIGTLPV